MATKRKKSPVDELFKMSIKLAAYVVLKADPGSEMWRRANKIISAYSRLSGREMGVSADE